jgi:hypothetical protein
MENVERRLRDIARLQRYRRPLSRRRCGRSQRRPHVKDVRLLCLQHIIDTTPHGCTHLPGLPYDLTLLTAEDFLPFVNPDLSHFYPICTTGS